MGDKRVLIFTPHPDDHISAAGVLFKLKKQGYQIYEVLFTDGETGGQIGKTKVDSEELVEIRNDEFAKASELLGTKETFKLHLPTNGLDYSRELFFDLIKIIREVRPELALIPHQADYHRDHRKTAEIAYDALRAANNSFKLDLGDRYRTPVVLHYRGLNPLDSVDILVDISQEFKQVEELVLVYSSQITPRLKQYTEGMPMVAGYYMRTEYAEEFEVPKNMPLFPSQVLADLAS